MDKVKKIEEFMNYIISELDAETNLIELDKEWCNEVSGDEYDLRWEDLMSRKSSCVNYWYDRAVERGVDIETVDKYFNEWLGI